MLKSAAFLIYRFLILVPSIITGPPDSILQLFSEQLPTVASGPHYTPCLLAMIDTNFLTPPVAKVPLINCYEAILLSLYGLPILIFCDLSHHNRFSTLTVQVSLFPVHLAQHSNSFSILTCLHSFDIKLYRHTNMKKKLFRDKAVISKSWRNEYIFLKPQFLYSFCLVLLERRSQNNLFCTLLYSIISPCYQDR